MSETNFALSLNNHKIRLSNERWFHITEGHSEIAGYYYEILETISNPEFIYQGRQDELLAVKQLESNKYLVVIYKEIEDKNGFVITSFLTTKINYLKNKKLIWEKST